MSAANYTDTMSAPTTQRRPPLLWPMFGQRPRDRRDNVALRLASAVTICVAMFGFSFTRVALVWFVLAQVIGYITTCLFWLIWTHRRGYWGRMASSRH